MIDLATFSPEWIRQVSESNRNADPILVEKAARALYLLEQLRLSGLDFIFKGGTALLITLPATFIAMIASIQSLQYIDGSARPNVMKVDFC